MESILCHEERKDVLGCGRADAIFVSAYICIVHPWSESKTRKQVQLSIHQYGRAGTVPSCVRRPANRRAIRSPSAPDLPEGAKWTMARSSTLLHAATSRCWLVLVGAGSNLLYEFPTHRRVTRFEATNIRQQDSSIQPATQYSNADHHSRSFNQILWVFFSEP